MKIALIKRKKSGDIYYLKYRVNGKQYYRSSGTRDIAEARQIALKLQYQFEALEIKPTDKNIKLSPLLQQYKDSLLRRSESYHSTHQIIVLKQMFAWIGQEVLDKVTAQDIDGYIIYRRNKGRKEKTLKHDFDAAKAFFKWCVARNYLNKNPLEADRAPKVHKRRPTCPTVDEFTSLIDNCTNDKNGQELRRMIIFAYCSGLRREKLDQMLWSDINFKTLTIKVDKQKNGDFNTIYLIPKIRDLLTKEYLTNRPDEERYFEHRVYPDDSWRTLRKKTGLMHIRWHDLRHGYASRLAESGASLKEMQELMGHRNIASTMIYAHLTEEHKKDVIKRVMW